VEWWLQHPIDDDLALLRFNDEQVGGRGFVDWYPVEHPQLGPVEIGGWDFMRFWFNPPDELLEAEVAPHSRWEISCALATPRLSLRSVEAVALAPDVWRVRAVVENDGWMPTNVTQHAIDKQLVGPVEVDIELAPGARLENGRARVALGQLAGRSRVSTMVADWGTVSDPTSDRAVAEWVVRAPGGSTLGIVAAHPRAGRTRAEVVLS
jgi:hypothetical protein